MEIFMRNIPYAADELQIVRALEPILHGQLFSPFGGGVSGGAPFNFIVNLIKGGKRRQRRHSGNAKLALPSMEIADHLLYVMEAHVNFKIHDRKISFQPSRDQVKPDILAILSQPYQDPQVLEERQRRIQQLGGTIDVKSVRFGYPCHNKEVSIEWKSPSTETWTLEFSPETHAIILKSTSTLRIAILVKSISSVTLNSNECAFWMERPPIFEKNKQPPVLPKEEDPFSYFIQQMSSLFSFDDEGTENTPTRNRLVSPDPAQTRLFAFLRVICVSLQGGSSISEFERKASLMGMTTYAGSHTITTRIRNFSPAIMEYFDAWLRQLPFDIAFQINALVSHAKFHPVELIYLRQEFTNAYNWFGGDAVCSRIKWMMQGRDEEPTASALDLFKRSVGELENTRDKAKRSRRYQRPLSETFNCHRVMVTPTSFVLNGPFPDETNRVLRKYMKYQSNFVRVEFREEDRLQMRWDRQVDGAAFIDERVGGILQEGLDIAGRHFSFLAYSSSALREHAVWFITPFTTDEGEHVTAESIIRSLGNFNKVIKCPARYGARIAQAFSTTEESVKIEPEAMITIPDIVSPSNSMFTDGVGLISPDLAEEVWEIYTESRSKRSRRRLQTPTAYQIRLGGIKGMLCVDNRLEGRVVCIRPSMTKFESPDRMIEIAKASDRPMKMFLNRPLIMLLETLEVPLEPIMELQQAAVEETKEASESFDSAARLLQDNGLGTSFHMTSVLLELHKAFVDLQSTRDRDHGMVSFLKRSLNFAVNHVLRDLKYKARIPIPVPDAWTLVGVADEWYYLKEDQIYAYVCDTEGRKQYIEGPVLISRSPTVHPGDARMVWAAGELPSGAPEGLRNLTNCVVFNCRGEQSLPSALAGGDLDGDIYCLILDERLHARVQFPAGEYPPAELVELNRPSTSSDVADFVVNYIKNDILGLIAMQSLRTADLRPKCMADPDCVILAELHSKAVDFAKTGNPVKIGDLPKFEYVLKPDWYASETNTNQDEFYESQRHLGKLFRAIQLPAIPEARRVARRQRRRYNEETKNDFQAISVREVFTNDDNLISKYVCGRIQPDVFKRELQEVDDALIDEMLEICANYASELGYLCKTHSLSNKYPISEEEMVAGTIVTKCSQPRMRQDAISAMRRDSDALCETVREEIKGPKGTSEEQQTLRVWTAWKVAVAFEDAFGTKSFGLLALDVIFDLMATRNIENSGWR